MTQLFDDGSSEYDDASRRQLVEDLFFEDEGKKTFFVLDTNAKCMNVNIDRYVKHLEEERGANNGGVLTADVSVLEKYNIAKHFYADIFCSFTMDLKNPTKIEAHFYYDGEKKVPDLTQTVVKTVGNRPSNVTDVEKELNEYMNYSNLSILISDLDVEKLKLRIEENKELDFNRLFDLQSATGKAIQKHASHSPVFSKSYLYNEEHKDDIPNMLEFLKDHLEPLNRAILIDRAAKKLKDIFECKGYDFDGVPDHLAEMGNKIVDIAVDLVQSTNDKKIQDDCVECMSFNISKLNYILSGAVAKETNDMKLSEIKATRFEMLNQKLSPEYKGPKFGLQCK